MVALVEGQGERHLYSQSWYRVAPLRPRLRSHIHVQRQVFRDREWYVLHDRCTGRFHRVSPEAYFLVALMDGKRTMSEIWEAAAARLGDRLPTQDETIALMAQLHDNVGLQCDLPPDMTALSARSLRARRDRWFSRLSSPTSQRLPLFDPDRFLDRTRFLVAPLVNWRGGVLWLSVVLYGLLQACVHWNELTANVTDRVLTLENVVALSLLYPAFKVFHELGHAYAVKHWGGEVHEMGVMLLVFIPVPYVDATASYRFRDKSKRMLVGAAGILVELFLAAVGVIIWLSAEPGAVRSAAYNMMLIGFVSTLLVNANPLVRYDAYYVLADFLEIPNLYSRSGEYLGNLLQRRFLGMSALPSTAASAGEARWLLLYGVLSSLYRLFIMAAILLFLAGKSRYLGVLMLLWSLPFLVLRPLVRIMGSVRSATWRLGSRMTAVGVGGGALLLALVAVPVPVFTVVEGVVIAPADAQVTAGADGFVARLLAEPNATVERGRPLVLCEAGKLEKEVGVLRGRLAETQARYRVSLVTDRVEAGVLSEEMGKARAELGRARERVAGLVVRSPADGVYIFPLAGDLPGRFVNKGDALGQVVDFSKATVRIVVGQDDVDWVRNRTTKVEARLASDLSIVLPAKVVREVPAASTELPSLALSLNGGGGIALAPTQSDKPLAFRQNFQFDVDLAGAHLKRIGERAFVRFQHDPEPVATRLYRNLRRVLIKRFES
ncbi:HlyD family efflux transporter periplasmic adaptor subunit [Geomonas paludis]|uniref:HlyD family efflux transporter periplasmic adaptor subunit n=1 Tax=Geomonas paludis TaxID=2740185 RepID=A0A6V8MTI4_9BACT|nr:HlyD family efflux transporter periplasmic adaptor subunit [Geomonas paludis]UPU38000.1 HlyD family efflux transporter periplasmic adaptor subunit [Geomonas paludis]GFO63475.1 hypothetical protein GMPD_13940 [Geomonas paludis]